VAVFPLVAMQQYAVRIETPIGSWPEAENTITYASEGIGAGQTDVLQFNLAVPLPAPVDVTQVERSADLEPDSTLSVGFSGLGTRFTTLSQRFATTYTVDGPAPELGVFLVDAQNLALMELGEPAGAVWIGGPTDEEIALPSSEQWYLVLANDGEVSAAAVGELHLEVLPEDGIDWSEPSELTVPFEILPQGRMVVAITPAE